VPPSPSGSVLNVAITGGPEPVASRAVMVKVYAASGWRLLAVNELPLAAATTAGWWPVTYVTASPPVAPGASVQLTVRLVAPTAVATNACGAPGMVSAVAASESPVVPLAPTARTV